MSHFSITHEEYYRMHGTLTAERIEDLFERASVAVTDKVVDSAVDSIKEGQGQFPDEDFLSGPIEDLHTLGKKLRGDNKAAVLAIIEKLDDIAQCQVNATEYGNEKFRQAIDTLSGSGSV